MSKRLGIIPHLYAQPLFHGLKSGDNPFFTTIEESSPELEIKLRQKSIDGAFLSPIDYAKDYAMYRIVPEVAAISEGESGAILLFFNEHEAHIDSIAVHPHDSSEIVLANIILSEKFDTKPKIIPTTHGIESGLKHADAYLAVGNEALSLQSRTNKIDLVDEWKDITDLPFVHDVWVARENALTKDELKALISEGKKGAGVFADELDDKFKNFRYDLDEIASASLTEFFRMAYYHGILGDITDLKFFTF